MEYQEPSVESTLRRKFLADISLGRTEAIQEFIISLREHQADERSVLKAIKITKQITMCKLKEVYDFIKEISTIDEYDWRRRLRIGDPKFCRYKYTQDYKNTKFQEDIEDIREKLGSQEIAFNQDRI